MKGMNMSKRIKGTISELTINGKTFEVQPDSDPFGIGGVLGWVNDRDGLSVRQRQLNALPMGSLFTPGTCKICGWFVIGVTCDESWGDGSFEHWAYCSNKKCEKHDGEGVDRDLDWIRYE